jgi:hypothetical protein
LAGAWAKGIVKIARIPGNLLSLLVLLIYVFVIAMKKSND